VQLVFIERADLLGADHVELACHCYEESSIAVVRRKRKRTSSHHD
jgi:hypothetical protein